MTDILVIVGPRSFADVQAPTYIRNEILSIFQMQPPDEVWSGGADGGDSYAEAAVREFGYEYGVRFKPILPRINRWSGKLGFKDRDEHMAQKCTRLLGFACRWPSSYGAIYTARKAEELGKPVRRIVLPWDVTNGQVDLWDANGDLLRLRVRGGVFSAKSPKSPAYAEGWIGEPIDPILAELRRKKHRPGSPPIRVRWTSEYPDVRAADGGTREKEDGAA